MLARVTHGKYGLADYLISGKKQKDDRPRTQKDNVTTLYGNLNVFKECEKWLSTNKSYKSNYLHITLGFSAQDEQSFKNLTPTQKIAKMQDIVIDYLKYYASGYNLDNVIAYAELHEPKENAQLNELGKQRFSHIHISLALYNPITKLQLRPPFFNLKRDDAFKNLIAKKYGLEVPMKDNNREKNYSTKILTQRNFLKDILRNYKKDEIQSYINNNKNHIVPTQHGDIIITYSEVKTAKNHYYKATIKDFKGKESNVNLRGSGFEHLDLNIQSQKQSQQTQDFDWDKWYQNRRDLVAKTRRKQSQQTQIKSISFKSYKQKIVFEMYRNKIPLNIKGLYIDKSQKRFYTQSNSVNVSDKGDKLVALGKDNKKQVKLMLDIAEAKGWNLLTIKINGDESFKAEAEAQISQRLMLKREHQTITKETIIKQKNDNFQKGAVAEALQDKRTYTPIQSAILATKAANQKYDINAIKQYFKDNRNLNFLDLLKNDKNLSDKIKNLDLSRLEVIGDLVLNNANLNQKPINIIDFLAKNRILRFTESLEWLSKHIEIDKVSKNAELKIKNSKEPRAEIESARTATPQMPQNRDIADTKTTAPIQPKSAEVTPSVEKTPKIEQPTFNTLALRAISRADNETAQTLSFEIKESFAMSKTAKMHENTAKKYAESLTKHGMKAEIYKNPKAERADFSFGVIFAKTSEALALAIEYMKSKLGLTNKEPETPTQKLKENEISNPSQTKEIKTLNNKPKINEKSKSKQKDSYGMSM